jgi:hypothetical protein
MIIALAVGALVASGPASAQSYDPDIDPLELKCVQATSKTLAKFTGAKTKCVLQCMSGARKGLNPVADCYAPYSGGAADCITDPTVGAETKSIAAIQRKCDEVPYPGRGCPECYDGGDCSASGYAGQSTASIESQIDGFATSIWCDPLNADPDIQKCQDNVARTFAKFVKCKTRCYDKCNVEIARGHIPPGSCTPPSPSYYVTSICIADGFRGCEAHARDAIDKRCLFVGSNPPCYGSAFDTGFEWVNSFETAVDGTVAQTYCGSPSGGFLSE